jgi:hypothetical protein
MFLESWSRLVAQGPLVGLVWQENDRLREVQCSEMQFYDSLKLGQDFRRDLSGD